MLEIQSIIKIKILYCSIFVIYWPILGEILKLKWIL